MSSDNGFLSQEEIDALLNGGASSQDNDSSEDKDSKEIEQIDENEDNQQAIITDIEKDLLGEIGNISMGSASTTLSTLLGNPVNITTPQVNVTTLKKLKTTFQVPNIALEVKYISGIIGGNLLVMKVSDAAVIANLMMGGNGVIDYKESLTEIEESAVQEAMNQMIGSAATAMATMFSREINISPPVSKVWDENSPEPLSNTINDDDSVVQVSFKLTIGNLVDSTIMQILPIKTAKKIVSIMMGQEEQTSDEIKQTQPQKEPEYVPEKVVEPKAVETHYEAYNKKPEQSVNIKKANFGPLEEVAVNGTPKNIDLILDVPLEISVVLGKAKMTIKDILALGTGSLIELDKLAEEPVEIYINGKKVAYGEVVVVDENFGVRIVSIVSNEERVKSLKG